jgi:hypothetical protein
VTPVAAVADGMKAWEVMRGRAYAFDLVLTEVNMPTLSGIDLLSRIVAADECRNIPVISKQPPVLPSFLPPTCPATTTTIALCDSLNCQQRMLVQSSNRPNW